MNRKPNLKIAVELTRREANALAKLVIVPAAELSALGRALQGLAVRLHNATNLAERACVQCGCTDSRACPGGCSWVMVHRATATGVCSQCWGAFLGQVDQADDQPGAALPARRAGRRK